MSIDERYNVSKTPRPNTFVFKSIGNKGEIWKGIVFQKTGENKYNLAFGDLTNGNIDDEVVSDNDDLRKVISTVVYTLYYFLSKTLM